MDARGRKIVREVRFTADLRDFKGQAGLPWVVVAANPHLSTSELLRVMASYGCERKRGWVSRVRWMFVDPRRVRKPGGSRNPDGQDARAYRIMGENPHVSARELMRVLCKAGIARTKDWVLRHRGPVQCVGGVSPLE
jgi:hypothetical protein